MQVALRAFNGQYIAAIDAGSPTSILIARAKRLDIWENFTRIDYGDGNVALKSHNGQFVAAPGGGGFNDRREFAMGSFRNARSL